MASSIPLNFSSIQDAVASLAAALRLRSPSLVPREKDPVMMTENHFFYAYTYFVPQEEDHPQRSLSFVFVFSVTESGIFFDSVWVNLRTEVELFRPQEAEMRRRAWDARQAEPYIQHMRETVKAWVDSYRRR